MRPHPCDPISDAASFVEILRWRATHQPEQCALTFDAGGEDEGEGTALSFAALDRRARALAARLQELRLAGERAVLLYPPGLEFVAAFVGCLYAGVVAVPASPPRVNRPMTRLRAIVAEARPGAVLTTSAQGPDVPRWAEQIPELAGLHHLATDALGDDRADDWRDPGVGRETLAFLQYTSGSTADSKGVMVTHGNLLHNSALIHRCFGSTPESRGVFWLPLYHDMGLIGGVLQTLYCGGSSTLLSPVAFLQRPLRWLRAISRTAGDDQRRAQLRLRPLRPQDDARAAGGARPEPLAVAFNGAEPIRAETLDRFAEAFAPCGFRREAFLPCYGLAEATLLVSGGPKSAPPVVRAVRPEALGAGPGRPRPRRRPAGAGAGRLRPGPRRPGGRDRRPRGPDPLPRRRGRRDLGLRPERRAGLLGPPRGDRAVVPRHPGRHRRGAVPADRRPRLPPRRRAVRHRPAQGPDHHPGPQRLSPGRRVDRRAVPPRAPARGRRGVRGRGRRRGAARRRPRGRAPGQGRGRSRRSSRPSARPSPRSTSWTFTPSRLLKPASLPKTSSGKVQRHACREGVPRRAGSRSSGRSSRRSPPKPRPRRPPRPRSRPRRPPRARPARPRRPSGTGWPHGWRRRCGSSRRRSTSGGPSPASGSARCRRSAWRASSRTGSAARSRRRSSTSIPRSRRWRGTWRASRTGRQPRPASRGPARTSRSRSSGSAAASRAPTARRRSGGCSATASTPSARSRRTAGTSTPTTTPTPRRRAS